MGPEPRQFQSRNIGRRREDELVREQNGRYRMLFHVGQIITSETNLDLLFHVVMEETNKIMGTERSTVFLHDERSKELWSLVATGMRRNEIRMPDNYGAAGWCFHNRTHLLINDAYDDPRFYEEIDRKSGFLTRNLLCIPLINRQDERIGALQTLNKKSGEFTDDDIILLDSLSYYVCIALENAKLVEEMKNKEAALRQSEEKYRTIIESIEDGYYEVDLGGNLVFFNKSMAKILGYRTHEMIGMNNRNFMSAETAKRVFEKFNEVFRIEKPTKAFGWELIRKDGQVRYVETSVSAVRDSFGRIKGFRGIARDITELKALDKARERVMNHLSHEMRTPLSVIGGVIYRLENQIEHGELRDADKMLTRARRNVNRLLDLQCKIDDILGEKASEDMTKTLDLVEGALSLVGEIRDDCVDPGTRRLADRVVERLEDVYSIPELHEERIDLVGFLESLCREAVEAMGNREIDIQRDFIGALTLKIDAGVLKKACGGLLRNAIQNTPDEGRIRIGAYRSENVLRVEFQDYGVGITEENQKMVLGGFFHTQDTSLYTTKEPYQFGAGGSGADLLRMKVLSERMGFSLDFRSTRCAYLPGDTDLCPGRISMCGKVAERSECFRSGGSTFILGFPANRF